MKYYHCETISKDRCEEIERLIANGGGDGFKETDLIDTIASHEFPDGHCIDINLMRINGVGVVMAMFYEWYGAMGMLDSCESSTPFYKWFFDDGVDSFVFEIRKGE